MLAGLVVAVLLYSWGVFRLGGRRWKRRHDETCALLQERDARDAEREAHEIDQRRRIEQETRALRGALTGALARLRR